jgi:hypothetical protein
MVSEDDTKPSKFEDPYLKSMLDLEPDADISLHIRDE